MTSKFILTPLINHNSGRLEYNNLPHERGHKNSEYVRKQLNNSKTCDWKQNEEVLCIST